MIEMHVVGISVDQNSGGAVLFLQDDTERTLPIWIGLAEATAIAKELEGVELARPLTHDLFRDTLRATGVELTRIEVIDLRDNTYFAEIVLTDSSGRSLRVDSRPSDAVALAVRVNAPIFVHEQVLQKAQPPPKEMPAPTDKEGWKKLLEEMDPEDFGKYKM
jgi:bifunctional DNase/RNase